MTTKTLTLTITAQLALAGLSLVVRLGARRMARFVTPEHRRCSSNRVEGWARECGAWRPPGTPQVFQQATLVGQGGGTPVS
jgi:hypothetical protein